MRHSSYVFTLVCLLPVFIAGCDERTQAEEIRPVRTIVVGGQVRAAATVVTGHVAAHAYVNASFRVPGKFSQRLVSAGSTVKAGQLLARLDDTVFKDALTSANAEVSAAKAALELAEKLEGRNGSLLKSNAVSQNAYDETLRGLKSARSDLDAAEAKARIAKEQLDYTQLKAETDGVVTERLAEVGEVLTAAQPVFRIAQNKKRDAVFEMPEDIIRSGLALGHKLDTCLDRNRDICATATVYEIAPEADPVTRTYQTKAAFENGGSPQMLLGSTILGRFVFKPQGTLQIPAPALTISEKTPAVWLVDPSTQTVTLRPVGIAQYTTDRIVLANGLEPGDRIVTAGVQSLREGQKVRALEESHEVR